MATVIPTTAITIITIITITTPTKVKMSDYNGGVFPPWRIRTTLC
jgi:hypothetical protein